MTQRHLHAQIGDAISKCKRRLFQRLKDNQPLDLALDQFLVELRLAFNTIEAENLNPEPVKD